MRIVHKQTVWILWVHFYLRPVIINNLSLCCGGGLCGCARTSPSSDRSALVCLVYVFFRTAPASIKRDLKCELISWLLCRVLWGFRSHIKATAQIYPRTVQLNLLPSRHPSFIRLLVLRPASSVLLRTGVWKPTFWLITIKTLMYPSTPRSPLYPRPADIRGSEPWGGLWSDWGCLQ